MISALFILNPKGETLISRLFRYETSPRIVDAFRLQVLKEREIRSPLNRAKAGNNMFLHVRTESGLYVLVVVSTNVDATLVFECINKIMIVFKSYFGTVDEEAVRNNFVLIYELLDEILDYGYPQITQAEVLKLYITQKSTRFDKKLLGGAKDEQSIEQISKRMRDITGAVSWREPGIKYKKNEIFIDVVEKVNLMMSAKGGVLKSDVAGTIQIKCFLTGMPECRFGMNDKLLMEREARHSAKPAKRRPGAIELDDCTFHQCVKLSKFDTDRIISFVPPDGEFELMKYRTTDNVNLPFRVLPIVEETGTTVTYKLSIKSNFHANMFSKSVIVKIPTPPNTASAKIKSSGGKAKYSPADSAIIWKLSRFPGHTEYQLYATVGLIATVEKKVWSRPPISMAFQVHMFTASGLNIRFLKVMEPRIPYQTIKWVRYITTEGSYEHRF